MKKYIRAVCIFLAGIMLTASTACTSEHENALENDKPCTLRFSWWGGDERHTATLEAIELFESKYPDINIEAEYGGWDGWTEKVTAQLAGDTAPDIMQINYDWLLRFSKDGTGFYDLEKLGDTIHLENYSDEVLDYGRQNGVLNAMPVSLTGRSIFFNKTTFDEIGADIPKTWNELINLGSVFREYDSYPLDLDIQSGFTAWYLTVVYSQQLYGKEFITIDGNLNFTVEEIEQALEFYKMLEDNYVVRTVKQRVNDDGNDALYQSSGFIDGSVAGMIEWGSAVGKYEQSLGKDKLVIGNLLMLENAEVSGWFVKPSLMYAINADTEYPEECAEFLNFILNDEECSCILGTSRGIPASSSAYKALEENDMLNGLAYESYVQINSCNPLSISPYMELSEMRECYNEAIESISYGVTDTHSAAVKMHDKLQKILKSFRE
ncbi:MAG: ABC transporter substrate-binding protein [Oscillospiraceae bacterium]